jgi:superfamily II DNA or RNA helicase
MTLRPYQQQAVEAVAQGWGQWRRQLGVAATGAGKTIMFAHIAAQEAGRTLVLAHRAELVQQAADKIASATGLDVGVHMAHRIPHAGARVVVASVQTMQRRMALNYGPDSFALCIADEAHHVLSPQWQEVLGYFGGARLLGVTATPDRGDRKQLREAFDGVAFDIGLLKLISEGYLSPLRATALDVELDAASLRLVAGEISADSAAEVLEPKLEELAREIARHALERKMLVFLPLCSMSERFASLLRAAGLDARHVAGDSPDRAETLHWFASAGKGAALCNAMLLTEGYDQPDVDCIACLRPVRSRALYQQIVGRGTRTAPGKEYCLLLDPLWLTGKHSLCGAPDLVAATPEVRERMAAAMADGADLGEAHRDAEEEAARKLAEALAEKERTARAPKGLVDPLAWSIGIEDVDLATYEPTMAWEEDPPTAKQLAMLERCGLSTGGMTRGLASALISRLIERQKQGLATAKQISLLRRAGHAHAGSMTREEASRLIARQMQCWGR